MTLVTLLRCETCEYRTWAINGIAPSHKHELRFVMNIDLTFTDMQLGEPSDDVQPEHPKPPSI